MKIARYCRLRAVHDALAPYGCFKPWCEAAGFTYRAVHYLLNHHHLRQASDANIGIGGLLEAPPDAHPILHTLTSHSNEWYTPSRYVDAAREVLGTIDLGPASNALANETVQAATFYDQRTDGLNKPWPGRVWLNPPYGRAEAGGSNQDIWSLRLIDQYHSGVTTEAILLVNAAVDTAWFQRLFAFPVCFPDGRINFDTPDGATSGSTHGSALVYLGPQRDCFIDVFGRFGAVVEKVDAS